MAKLQETRERFGWTESAYGLISWVGKLVKRIRWCVGVVVSGGFGDDTKTSVY